MSIACVASMYVHAAVASLWEVAMLSAPVFDSCEGPKRQGAIADAIFEKKFSPRTVSCPCPAGGTVRGVASKTQHAELRERLLSPTRS